MPAKWVHVQRPYEQRDALILIIGSGAVVSRTQEVDEGTSNRPVVQVMNFWSLEASHAAPPPDRGSPTEV